MELPFLDRTKAMFCRTMCMMLTGIKPEHWAQYVKQWTVMTCNYLDGNMDPGTATTRPGQATVSSATAPYQYANVTPTVASVTAPVTGQALSGTPANARPPPAHQVHSENFFETAPAPVNDLSNRAPPTPIPLPLADLGHSLNFLDQFVHCGNEDWAQYLGPSNNEEPNNNNNEKPKKKKSTNEEGSQS